MQILAATDFSTRSNRALRQAGLLAQTSKAQLYILHVVDDDQPEELVSMERREALRLLAEQVRSMPELQDVACEPDVIIGDPFDGILRTAENLGTDLIVMGAHRRHLLLDIFVGTTVERVVRRGSFPVLMVNNEAQRRYENVVASLDISEASAHALTIAQMTGLVSDCGVTLVHAFQSPGKGKLFVANADRDSIDSYVATERQRTEEELAAFLSAKNLKDDRWSMRLAEGEPMEVISQIVDEMRPDLLIMGTRARSGLIKTLIGSVTEEALRSLNVDILAVPPPRKS